MSFVNEVQQYMHKNLEKVDLKTIFSSDSFVEFECRMRGINNKKIGRSKPITYNDFVRVMSRLTMYSQEENSVQLQKYIRQSVKEYMTIGYYNWKNPSKKVYTRHEIPLQYIPEYCSNPFHVLNDTSKVNKIIKFTKEAPANLAQNDTKCTLKYEIDDFEENNLYPDEVNDVIRQERTYDTESLMKMKKTFRNVKRISFVSLDKLFSIDCSIVQEMSGISLQEDVDLGSKSYKYEIEIECNPLKENLHTEKDFEKVFSKRLTEELHRVNQALQNSLYFISPTEQKEVLRDLQNVKTELRERLTSKISKSALKKANLITSKPVPLKKRSEIVQANENEYTVTDKADGETRLLFISKVGKIYLLSMKGDITSTGLSISNNEYKNTILVGEYVVKDKDNNTVSKYFVFDIYICPAIDQSLGKPISEWKLYSSDPTEKTRLSVANKIVTDIQAQIPTENPFEISCKTFYASDENKTLLEYSQQIWENEDSFDHYHLDGLIFTPKNKPIQFGTWKLTKKWKPAEHNTVDVLVRFEDHKNIENTAHVSLYYADQVVLREAYGKRDIVYKPVLLTTVDMSYTNGHLVDEEGNGVRSDTIVECILNNGVWKLKRSRPDKTSLYEKNRYEKKRMWVIFKKQIALAERKANGSKKDIEHRKQLEKQLKFSFKSLSKRSREKTFWEECTRFINSYEDIPVFVDIGINNKKTVDDIIALSENPVELFAQSQQKTNEYYGTSTVDIVQRVAASKKIKITHNEAKRFLLKKALKAVEKHTPNTDVIRVLELACGRGGDIHKWKNLAKKLYKKKSKKKLEIDAFDMNESNIRGLEDSAENRWKEVQRKSRVPIKELTYTWNVQDVTEPLSNLTEQYSIVSCQFAMHYFLENENKWSNFLNNVKKALHSKGVLAVSFPLRSKIEEYLLHSNNIEKYGYTFRKGDGAWNNEPFGNEYEVKIPSSNSFIPEYLVQKQWVVEDMEKNGFKNISNKYKVNIESGLTSKSKIGFSETLNEDEKKIVQLYETVIFQKQ